MSTGGKMEGYWHFLPTLTFKTAQFLPYNSLATLLRPILWLSTRSLCPIIANSMMIKWSLQRPHLLDFSPPYISLHLVTLRHLLEQPLTLEEVETAIRSLPSSKTPDLDGLPSEWYQAYSKTLAAKLLATFHASLDLGILPDSMNVALIVVIPKPGKDKLLCGSYHPISILNNDPKVLAIILALRLQKIILSLITPDQSGFMPWGCIYISISHW